MIHLLLSKTTTACRHCCKNQHFHWEETLIWFHVMQSFKIIIAGLVTWISPRPSWAENHTRRSGLILSSFYLIICFTFAKSSDPHFSQIFLLFLAHPAPDQPQHSLIFPFFHPVPQVLFPQVPVPQVPVPQVAAAAPPWVSSTLLPIGAASVVRSFPASHPVDSTESPEPSKCPMSAPVKAPQRPRSAGPARAANIREVLRVEMRNFYFVFGIFNLETKGTLKNSSVSLEFCQTASHFYKFSPTSWYVSCQPWSPL